MVSVMLQECNYHACDVSIHPCTKWNRCINSDLDLLRNNVNTLL